MKRSKTNDEMLGQLSDFLSLLTEKQRDDFFEIHSIEHFKKGDAIYREGEVPQYLHCLIDGKVKLYKEGVGGRTQIMRIMKPISFFGYRAHLANENYVNAAGAFENCNICMIPIEYVERWMEENNQVAMYFVRLLATELGNSDERTVSLTQKHVRGRLAESLIFLTETYGLEEDGCTLSCTLSREDLANLSNMTTSNAIRTLSAFQTEQIISIDKKKISIIDIDMLKHISKMG